jgi:predicted kinase
MTSPSALVITGPAAAGKNAVASQIAELVPALAVIDIDAVRWMILKPHVAPWGGDEGRRQQELGVRNGCQLAKKFVESGFPTVVVDVVTTWTAPLYRDLLGDLGCGSCNCSPSGA